MTGSLVVDRHEPRRRHGDDDLASLHFDLKFKFVDGHGLYPVEKVPRHSLRSPVRGARGFSELDAPVGEPVQAGHVSVRRGALARDRRYPVSDS
jgi:hypothetical protein